MVVDTVVEGSGGVIVGKEELTRKIDDSFRDAKTSAKSDLSKMVKKTMIESKVVGNLQKEVKLNKLASKEVVEKEGNGEEKKNVDEFANAFLEASGRRNTRRRSDEEKEEKEADAEDLAIAFMQKSGTRTAGRLRVVEEKDELENMAEQFLMKAGGRTDTRRRSAAEDDEEAKDEDAVMNAQINAFLGEKGKKGGLGGLVSRK